MNNINKKTKPNLLRYLPSLIVIIPEIIKLFPQVQAYLGVLALQLHISKAVLNLLSLILSLVVLTLYLTLRCIFKKPEINEWKIIDSNYDISEVSSGCFAYVPNKTHPNPKPTHYLCTNCFGKKIKSILQIEYKYNAVSMDYICPNCKTIILLSSDKS